MDELYNNDTTYCTFSYITVTYKNNENDLKLQIFDKIIITQ